MPIEIELLALLPSAPAPMTATPLAAPLAAAPLEPRTACDWAAGAARLAPAPVPDPVTLVLKTTSTQ